jgi:hypothetical protein
VFEVEPLPASSPLWALPNALLSPHCADRTADFQADAMRAFAANAARYVAGQALESVVDKARDLRAQQNACCVVLFSCLLSVADVSCVLCVCRRRATDEALLARRDHGCCAAALLRLLPPAPPRVPTAPPQAPRGLRHVCRCFSRIELHQARPRIAPTPTTTSHHEVGVNRGRS